MNDSSKNTLEVGTVLDSKWVVLELLGRGGMGEVYRVHQLNLKRDVALKVISTKFLQEIDDNEYEAETYLERFNREVQVMAQVRHPNVLQIFDCGSISVNQRKSEIPVEYITMEYIPGGTLRSTMSAEGFYPDEGCMREWLTAYFLPLLDGVQALHDAGIIHRDLKPENVLLDGNIPKIADFGLARSCRLKPVTQSVDMTGTPPYMSPEHFLDLKRTDARTDIYALGKILYEAASGKIGSDELPFKQAKLKNPGTPFYQNLDRVIQEATAEDRHQRLASVVSLKQAIQEVLSATDHLKYPIVDDRAQEVRSRKTWVLISVLALIVSISTGLGVMFFHKRGYMPPTSSVQFSPPGAAQEGAPNKQVGISPSAQKNVSPAPVLQGKDESTLRFIPGGMVTLPENFESQGGKVVRVDSFYLDETQVTNQQYVHFLNEVLPRIKVEDGLVRGDDAKVWLLLGEVLEGYEPIIYKDGRFSVKNAEHAACPVLRVTAFGTLAYAHFYGERLMTDVEWLRALKGGGATLEVTSTSVVKSPESNNPAGMHGMMGQQAQSPPPEASISLPIPSPVVLFKPNDFGIRGLNGNVGEWGLSSMDLSPEEKGENMQYVVLGGPLNKLKSGKPPPSAVRRYPWEAFTEVGFRCALSVTSESR
jgi:eukaryotic-like serine/threonine-protein kinase